MAITLRNKKVEQQIREIGQRTNEGPSAVIARLVAAEQSRAGIAGEAEAEARYRKMQRALDRFPPWTERQRAASRKIEKDMYDENGFPR